MQPRSATLLAPALMLLAAACATAGDASYRAMLSENQGLQAQRERDLAGSARALQQAALTRGSLIRAVLSRNPSAESAHHAWRAALARYRQAGAYEDPMLMASFAPLSIGAAHADFGYEVEISQRIPLGGKLDAHAALAVAEAQASRHDYAEARLRLALSASQLYDDYALALRSLEIQAQHVALMNAFKDSVVAAYASGHSAAQDSLQADAELAKLEYQKTVFETQRDVAVAQLNALLHRAPEAPLPPPAAAPLSRDDEPSAPEAITKLVQSRPDVAAARARIEVARARADAADRDFYPDLTLSTSYNSMWDMPEHRWMGGFALNLPLQRERRHGMVTEANAMRAAAESDAQSTTDAARGEIAVATRQLRQARQALALYETRLLPIARDRIEAARAAFIASQVSFMVVIEAERSLRSAELELEMTRAELGKRSAELDLALGRLPGLESHEVAP